MIVSQNRKPSFEEFSKLVQNCTLNLNIEAKSNETYFLTRNAQKLEDDVLKTLQMVAKGTSFENSIIKVSGQKFPDIVAGKYYGVEVKSSKDVNWTTLGGSINESTRVEDVERIFLTFGKLVSPIEFISRPYEECLSEVLVTHYPRYKIDMKLKSGETIFDKMEIGYDELRQMENPVRKVIQYYKSHLKKGERLWWFDDNDLEETSSPMVRLWKTLKAQEKHKFIIMAYAFFPEIIGTSQDKYDNFSLWLVSKYGIVSTSLRDSFSAGGKVYMSVNGISHLVSRSIYHLFEYRKEIKHLLKITDDNVLMDVWNVSKVQENKDEQWIELLIKMSPESKNILSKLLDEGNVIEF